MPDISEELKFRTSRSGGKGGQNVNKVETSVEGLFHVQSSQILNNDQKALISEKLSNRINSEGFLQVKSQTHRTQLGNKDEVKKKINELIEKALRVKKKRIATNPSKNAKQKRLERKNIHAEKKQNRQKFRSNDF